jgi:hypothetical protein
MTVAEFISFLQTQPQDIQVAYALYSEQCLLDAKDIEIAELCEARDDGWIHHKRPDQPTQTYLLLPGN